MAIRRLKRSPYHVSANRVSRISHVTEKVQWLQGLLLCYYRGGCRKLIFMIAPALESNPESVSVRCSLSLVHTAPYTAVLLFLTGVRHFEDLLFVFVQSYIAYHLSTVTFSVV